MEALQGASDGFPRRIGREGGGLRLRFPVQAAPRSAHAFSLGETFAQHGSPSSETQAVQRKAVL